MNNHSKLLSSERKQEVLQTIPPMSDFKNNLSKEIIESLEAVGEYYYGELDPNFELRELYTCSTKGFIYIGQWRK